MSEDGNNKDCPRNPFCIFLSDFRSILKFDELGLEIKRIALPASLALTANPIASLVDTTFIGPVKLAAVGVSIDFFNQVSRIAIFPLVVQMLKKDVVKTHSGELEKNGEYRQMLIQAINACAPIVVYHYLSGWCLYAPAWEEFFRAILDLNRDLGESRVGEIAKLELQADIFSSPLMIGGHVFVGCRDEYVHLLLS